MDDTTRNLMPELRKGLEDLYGDRLDRVILFGSQARGEEGPDSDIDVMIVLRGEFDYWKEVERVSWLASDLSLKGDCLISTKFISLDDYESRDYAFLRNVKRDGLLV